MQAFLEAMTLPFLACLLLAGIHVYLGIHVLARKVIFVDLALAQIAALGAVYGILLGYSSIESPWVIKGFSLLFTVIGAAIFALTKQRNEKVPQEALIGITYAAALAITILASSHLAHGADEVRELLSGSILWVDSKTILTAGILYVAIGIFHFIFRKQFFLISFDPEQAVLQNLNVRFWDFLFYVGFGFVVTSSVSIAGVLLVFCYLVIPAVAATLLSNKLSSRLYLGWLIGAGVSFVGVWYSYVRDLPSGPTIVVCFALFLLLIAAILFVVKSSYPFRQLGKVALVIGIIGGFDILSNFIERKEAYIPVVALQSEAKNDRLLALQMANQDRNLFLSVKPELKKIVFDKDPEIRIGALRTLANYWDAEILSIFHKALSDPNDSVREMVVRELRNHNDSSSLSFLWEQLNLEEDEYIKVEIAENILELGDAKAIPVLLDMIQQGETSVVKKEAFEHLSAHIDIPIHVTSEEVTILQKWWKVNHQNLKWNAVTKKFMLK